MCSSAPLPPMDLKCHSLQLAQGHYLPKRPGRLTTSSIKKKPLPLTKLPTLDSNHLHSNCPDTSRCTYLSVTFDYVFVSIVLFVYVFTGVFYCPVLLPLSRYPFITPSNVVSLYYRVNLCVLAARSVPKPLSIHIPACLPDTPIADFPLKDT
ncbi:hypothetical protein BC826DRAFT_80089 [Russula brevipes]|nr:hypothetical protein BC826DRAFT_80089 [Russula brevipes]